MNERTGLFSEEPAWPGPATYLKRPDGLAAEQRVTASARLHLARLRRESGAGSPTAAGELQFDSVHSI